MPPAGMPTVRNLHQMQKQVLSRRLLGSNLHAPTATHNIFSVRTLQLLEIIAPKLLPHPSFPGISGKRTAFSRLYRPIPAAPPVPATLVARCPEFVTWTSAFFHTAVLRQQTMH